MKTSLKRALAIVAALGAIGALAGVIATRPRLPEHHLKAFPGTGGFTPSSGGGAAVSSVTGSNNLTCSPTTGAVVCSGAAFATSASLATVATSGSASDLATGTLPAGRMPALTGDVTTSAGSLTTSITGLALTKLASVSDQRLVGNVSGGSAAPAALTATQVATMLGNAGLGATWAVLRQPAITALAPTLTQVHVLNTNNVTQDWETVAATTTGVCGPLQTDNGGVIQVKSGTTGTGIQICRTRDAAASVPAIWIANPKTSPWAIAMRVKVTTTQDANGTNVLMSMNDSAAEVSVSFRGPVSTTNFTLWVNGGGSTTVDTGQAVDVGTYHNVALVFDTTTLWLVYDDVKVNTGLATLTNFGTTPAYIRTYAVNGGTAANREHDIAYAAVYTPAPS